jgi:hypothetical protein
MEKLVYLSTDPLARTLRREREKFSAPSDVQATVLYTLDPADRGGAPSAVLTVWLACVDRREPIERFLALSGARFHGYVVTESSARRRSVAEVTRGTLELLDRPAALPRQAWLDSLEIAHEGMEHGLVLARNVIARSLTGDAPPLDVLREGVGAEARAEDEWAGERVSQLGLYTPGRSFVGERLTLRRGHFSA